MKSMPWPPEINEKVGQRRVEAVRNLARIFDNLLSVDELVESLGGRVSKRSIYRWVEREGLPVRRLGGRLYFNPESVVQWMEKTRS